MMKLRKMRRSALISLFFGLVCILTFLSFSRGWIRFNYPSAQRFPIRGVDVSHHQGEIDWPAVYNAGNHFAYLKATEGADLVDPRFEHNWTQARNAGLSVGAYHFFTFCSDGVSQANNFLATVPPLPDALAPTVDLEFGGNCSKTPGPAELKKELFAFLERLRAAYGCQPILYVTRESYDAYLRDDRNWAATSEIWVRDVFRSPRWLGERSWTFWQYGNRGHVAGITGLVDLNVFRGDRDAWRQFLSRCSNRQHFQSQ